MIEKTRIKYFISFVVVLCLTALIIVISSIFKININISENAEIEAPNELGEFAYESSAEVIFEDEYIPDIYDNVEAAKYYVNFSNPELIYDCLTLEALSHICEDTAEYLNLHGYSDIHTLTIDAENIVYDKAYPLFYCTLGNIEYTKLEIRYDLENDVFIFQIIQ